MFHPVIYGIKGTALSSEERAFFKKVPPFGFILFARNIENAAQVKALTADLRTLTGRKDTPILIDQEGGRVARLKPPHWRKAPPAKVFADLAARDMNMAVRATYLNARLIAAELTELGIDVDCAPMLDLSIPGAHDIVGDRAFGQTTEQITLLGRAMADGLKEGGVMPIIKHIPGHGRAMVDSHESLPVVDASAEILREKDFAPFKALADIPWAMTAHITYTALDKECATQSKKVVNIIRKEIGFNGVLLTDDLSMKALGGTFEERTRTSLEAGCDIVLHCNGEMEEMQAIANALPKTSAETLARIARGIAWLPKAASDAPKKLHTELAELIGSEAGTLVA